MMIKFGRLACSVAVFVGIGSAVAAQQSPEAVPDGPFETVHLMAVEPARAPALSAAIRDFNDELRRQGCPACAYHMFRMYSGSQSSYNVMVSATWPSRGEYLRIHDSAAFAAVNARNSIFSALEAKQFYGRFVEVR